MMSVEDKILEVEMEIEANPNYQSGLYRKFKKKMLEGSTKYKIKNEEWEGNIFAGKDIVDALKDGWWDCFQAPPKKEVGSAASGATTMDKGNPVRSLEV